MDIFKNSLFINTIWVILAVLFIIVGFYREELFKKENKELQNKIIDSNTKILDLSKQTTDLSQVILKKQNLFEVTLNNAVKSGQISQDTAKKLRNIYYENVSITATADMKFDAEVIKKSEDKPSSEKK